jgi:hypothetical protein
MPYHGPELLLLYVRSSDEILYVVLLRFWPILVAIALLPVAVHLWIRGNTKAKPCLIAAALLLAFGLLRLLLL